jgi:two-component system, NarL family, sensor kinase
VRTLAAGAAAATVLGLALTVAADGVAALARWGMVTPTVTALVLAALGGLLGARGQGRRIGLLFLGAGWASAASILGGGYVAVGDDRGWPGIGVVTSASEEWLWAFAVVPLTTVLLAVFPDGRAVSPRWRPLTWLGWATAVLLAVGSAVDAALLHTTVGAPLWTIAGLGGVASLAVRWRRSAGIARQQVKYLLLAALAVLLIYTVADLLPMALRQVAFLLVPLSLLGAVALAVLRYRLYDVDVVIRRTAVFTGLTIVVFLTYLGVGAALGTDPSERAALVAALVVAAVAEPARRRLQRTITRLLFGRRDEPLAAMAALRDRLRDATDEASLGAAVSEVVPRLVRTRRVALEVLVDGEERTVTPGPAPDGEALRLPLVHQSELLGTLVVGLREPGVPFGRADRVLLDELAHQVAAAAHAVRLTAELRTAAEQVVRAAAEERERLRRDLHDRLGPLLVGTGLTVDALRHGHDGRASDGGLAEVSAQLRSASAEVRRIVDRLQPAALEELGLVEAVRDHLGRLAALPGVPAFVLEAEDGGPLPPAAQEAGYFLLLEAVTNVLRHARARAATVRIGRHDGILQLEVVDDGVGLAEPYVAGVGIGSMRRRALQLGGGVVVGPGPDRGTRVTATIPLEEARWASPARSASSSPTTTPSSGSGCDGSSTPSPGSRSSARPPTPREPSPQPAS